MTVRHDSDVGRNQPDAIKFSFSFHFAALPLSEVLDALAVVPGR
jgi:hypothetical protein